MAKVEVMLRRKQAEAQDTDEDDSSSQHNEVKGAVTSDLLSVTIEQSAKEYLVVPHWCGFAVLRWLSELTAYSTTASPPWLGQGTALQ